MSFIIIYPFTWPKNFERVLRPGLLLALDETVQSVARKGDLPRMKRKKIGGGAGGMKKIIWGTRSFMIFGCCLMFFGFAAEKKREEPLIHVTY